MARLSKPPPSRLQSQRGSFQADTGRQSEQAGRSSTNLHAQLSAASLRPSRLPTPASQTSRPQTATGNGASSPVSPSTSVSLRPICTTVSSGSSIEGSDSSSHDASVQDANAAGAVLAQGFSSPPPTSASHNPASRPQEMRQISSSGSLSRTGVPRTLRDLGRDYTRYYDPFETPINRSSTDLAMPLLSSDPATGVQSETAFSDEPKRLSNPFSDEKRSANSFESKSPTPVEISVPVVALSSRNAMIDEIDAEKAFFPYLDDRLGAPNAEHYGYTFPLYWHEKEWDDDMHLPMIDDDTKLKPKLRDHFSRENVVSTIGLVSMIIGLLMIFVGLPVLSWAGIDIITYPENNANTDSPSTSVTWATVNANRTWPLLKNMRSGLIDPDTPANVMNKTLDGYDYTLVFSDEFNEQNRTFYPGDDPYFFAPDIWYGATQDLEWYDPDAVTTWGGALYIQMDEFRNHGLDYRSGMLQSWNQLCFKGGIFEVSVSLPGPAGVHGLWPGVWSMGNLGRPGYLATTDGMWPYTYNDCDVGITPNQSSNDGISMLPGQRLASCTCDGEDHPTPGTGRGAPEIDVIEVSGDWGKLGLGVATQSYQVAPFDIWWYPNYEYMQTPNYNLSFVNTYTGGPYQEAVSTTSMLNNDWYDGVEYQKYAYQYDPGTTEDSGISWWIADEMMMHVDARAIGPNGNIGQRVISEEPMSMVMNLGMSNSWVVIDFAALKFPTIMRIDYIRLYQKEGEEMVTCDPPGFETTEYIKNHPEAYNNPNYTHWTDIPGYTWPTNSFMSQC